MTEIITHLNKAAYFVLEGGRVIGFDGKYSNNCKVIIEIDQEKLNEINKRKKLGVTDYRDYMKIRAKIKTRIKKAYNIL